MTISTYINNEKNMTGFVVTIDNSSNTGGHKTGSRKAWSRLFGLSTLVVALSACQSIPKAELEPVVARPNLPLAGEGYELEDPNQQNLSHAAVRWQSFYTDPKLQQLIQLGLENNKDIRQAILAIQRAQAQYRITDNRDLPTLDGNASYARSSQAGYNNDSNVFQVGLGMASYELDFWGRIGSLKEQALQEYLSTAAAKETAQVSLIANIARSYVNLSYQLKQLELAQSTLESRERSLFITQARLEAGIDSKAPSLQAAASAEAARIAAYNAQSNILKARNALKYLVGAPITDEMLPEPAVASITSSEVLSAGLPSELLQLRPDILQAEHRLKAAGANIDVARAAYYPTISLTGNLGYRSDSLSDLFNSSAASWSFGPSINLPIFDAGQRDANYEVAQIERDQALANYESTIETAFREVNDVLAERATLQQRTASQYRVQDSFAQILEVSQARFEAQVDDYLGVLDAERSLFSAQQNILNLEQERLTNQIDLYQALGGGANLDPVTVPVSRYRNLVNVFDANNKQQKKAEVIKASSGPAVISAQQADAIEAAKPAPVYYKQQQVLPVTSHSNQAPAQPLANQQPSTSAETSLSSTEADVYITPVVPVSPEQSSPNQAN
ncbi:efflux transporter outer membrane subunit [Psychrobacter lutiphocae]|uniref:efflux transporter outer membrane subunit n=1 Tax=Psychrobacter lutiphocae TaxID=540500 RepID=UPI00037D9525|nr:efflux transporter outer membrane subunit [Psychrobacter lutiphocae]